MGPPMLVAISLILYAILIGVVTLLWRKVMKMDAAAKSLDADRQTSAELRAAYTDLSAALGSLKTALPALVEAMKPSGNVTPELEAAVLAWRDEGKSTLTVTEIIKADTATISQITEALLTGAKPAGDRSA